MQQTTSPSPPNFNIGGGQANWLRLLSASVPVGRCQLSILKSGVWGDCHGSDRLLFFLSGRFFKLFSKKNLDLRLSLPERPCCRDVMLREDLRPSLVERPCCREVMLFGLPVFALSGELHWNHFRCASPSCCIILTYIRRRTRGFRGPGRREVTFVTDRWRGLRLFRRCLTSGVFRWLFGGCSGRLCASGRGTEERRQGAPLL